MNPSLADAVTGDITRAFKLMAAIRNRSLSDDGAVTSVLFKLTSGPKRVTELTDGRSADLSVVSRQVTQAAHRGLVRKTSDPTDGRAQLVELTTSGHDAIRDVLNLRTDVFGHVFEEWSVDDISAFSGYLHRLCEGLESYHERTL